MYITCDSAAAATSISTLTAETKTTELVGQKRSNSFGSAAGAGVKLLLGDRIETPEYIKENNLKIDYAYYITNQFRKPFLQVILLLSDYHRV